jgi:hypothetical protein
MKKTSQCVVLCSLTLASSLPASTTAYWRLEEGINGSDVTAAVDSSGNGFGQSSRAGTPKYSDNVPGAYIFDPVSGLTSPNSLSLDASVANSRIRTVNNAAFNTSFTAEMFIQLTGQPGGYHNFMRRQESGTNRWQIDFDHAAGGPFGRGRARIDTADGDNSNLVAGPTGGAAVTGANRLWVDTPLGDGNPASYSGDSDWATQGDGANDLPGWHHIAVTLNTDTNEWSFYMDYQLMQTQTLVDIDSSGYVHPNGLIEFGKGGGGATYGTFIDEVRYSDGVLDSTQFLQATASIPEPSSALLSLLGGLALVRRRR